MDIQPRYAAYAAAHGRTPAAMLEYDRGEWPAGRMTGFILWINRRLIEWRAETGHTAPLGPQQHDDFTAWLQAEFTPAKEAA